MGLSPTTKWIVAHWTTVVDGLGVEVSRHKRRPHVHRSEERALTCLRLLSPATAAGEVREGEAKERKQKQKRQPWP